MHEKSTKTVEQPTSKAAGEKDARLAEFMQVMQTKKGPSWKDSDSLPAAPVASSSKIMTPPKVSQDSAYQEVIAAGDVDDSTTPAAAIDDSVSDMDWLKRHTKATLETDSGVLEKKFEQSDDEMDAEPAVPESKVCSFPLHSAVHSLTSISA